MTANEWVMQFLVGALFGALGQGIRVVVGLKKMNDAAVREGRSFAQQFSASTLLISLFIGAVAGVLGVLTARLDISAIEREDVVLLIGIGYAGADFIEGFVRKHLPAAQGDAGSASASAAQGVHDPAAPPGATDLEPAPPVG